MEMSKKMFIGLLGIFLAFSLVLTGCNNDTKDTDTTDPSVSPIEEAFIYCLKWEILISGAEYTVNTIKKMNNWGQTDSEYSIPLFTTGGNFKYYLPSSFGTILIISDGDGSVLMTGPDAEVVWGTPTSNINVNPLQYWYGYKIKIVTGSDTQVTHPFTVSFPTGSDAQYIGGNLHLNYNAP